MSMTAPAGRRGRDDPSRSSRRQIAKALFAGAIALLWAAEARAERAGEFGFYVLSLSWSPSYCARAGTNAGPLQCRAAKPHRFIVHGLWPQHERGYPDYCRLSDGQSLAPATVEAILDIMPSPSLVRHQWAKHGTCTGLSAEAYFDLTRKAYEKISIPAAFRTIFAANRMQPDAVELAFRLANPGLRDNAIAVDCQAGRLSEVRICMTRDLDFRPCPAVDRRGCRAQRILVPPPQ